MILLKEDMIPALENKDIYINKMISLDELNPNSINVTLGNKLKIYTPFKEKKTKEGIKLIKIKDVVLDVKTKNEVYEFTIPEEGVILSPDMFYLGNTVEKVGSNKFVPMYEGRSSLARLGLISHFSAGFGDIGFTSQWTLEISVKEPLKIYRGMRIGQVYFVKGTSDYPKYMYEGKYNGQTGPQESKMYLDYVEECNKSLECIVTKIQGLEDQLRAIPKHEEETIKLIQKERDELNLKVQSIKVDI